MMQKDFRDIRPCLDEDLFPSGMKTPAVENYKTRALWKHVVLLWFGDWKSGVIELDMKPARVR